MSDHSAAQKAALAVGAFAAAVAVGAIYVTVHESRRKAKKAKKEAAQKGERSSDGLSAEQLIAVLKESACAAYQLIEQVGRKPLSGGSLCHVLRCYALPHSSAALLLCCSACTACTAA